MMKATISEYIVSMSEEIPVGWGKHASLIDEFPLERSEWGEFYLQVQHGHDWPFLCVGQRYYPTHWADSFPGILLVPESQILFIGAGERLLAYDLRGPLRLWEDTADFGFHDWQRHDDVIVMSAEVGLAAWDIYGTKLWGKWVEPPWDYHVDGGTIHLDVMGTKSSFPLHGDPGR